MAMREEKFWRILRDAVPAADAALADATPILESGLLTSMALLQLVGALEEEFRIRIAPADIAPANFATPAAVRGLVVKCLAKA